MPAEWEPHDATWLAWPHEKSDWPGKFEPIPWLYGEIVRHLTRVERVRILVDDANPNCASSAFSGNATRTSHAVDFLPSRDQSKLDARLLPAFREERARKSRHHALAIQRLGEIFELRTRRPRCPPPSPKISDAKLIEPGLVLEGGSIDVNGAGKLLTTEECLLSDVQARNPGFSRRSSRRR